jgi:hypothetical protein
MSTWSAVVLAIPDPDGGPMLSRLPTFLHPVAGRPLIWHTVNSLVVEGNTPEEIAVVAPIEVSPQLFEDLPRGVRVLSSEAVADGLASEFGNATRLIAVHGNACLDPHDLRGLLAADHGAWLGVDGAGPAAIVATPDTFGGLFDPADPFAATRDIADPARRLDERQGSFVVRRRADLARVHQRVRDHLVRQLMEGGATFILPESTVVDVDVRIGRDSVIYPGVILEGQTTIGEETVIGPGCRIIDSWVGSGVELKGWNYIAHTSVRNRAILEPYVRRGFD